MPNIHVSSYIPSEIVLEPSKVPDQLDKAAVELRKIADQFNQMSQILRDKKIAISAVEGQAKCGSFMVDDIDAGRLKHAGVIADDVADLSKQFFIDPTLDAALAKMETTLEENFSREILHQDKRSAPEDEEEFICDDCLDSLSDEECDHDHGEECDHDSHQERVDYESVIRIEEDENGHQEIILNIQDQGNFLPSEVSLNKETQVFSYKCSSCDEIHQEQLSEVLGSLQAVIALVSNFYHSAEKNKAEAAAAAIATLEEDMRLIEALLHQQYPEAASQLDDDASQEEENNEEIQ